MAYFAHIGGFVFGLLTIKLFATASRHKDLPPRYAVHVGYRHLTMRAAVLATALLFIVALTG